MRLIIRMCIAVSLMTGCNNNNKEISGTDHSRHQVSAGNYADSINKNLIPEDTLKGSPHRTAMRTVNGTHVHIEYNSPGTKNRVIWGGLVAYDQVWVTGAHGATRIQFSKEVEIRGRSIPAGTYAFFTIPGKDEWIAIINSRYDQHLADEYNEKEDLVRIKVKPIRIAETPRLTYTIIHDSSEGGSINMGWDKLMISLPFKTFSK